jgi:hypothetical protein
MKQKQYNITRITEVIDGNGTGESEAVDVTTEDLEHFRITELHRRREQRPEVDDLFLVYVVR